MNYFSNSRVSFAPLVPLFLSHAPVATLVTHLVWKEVWSVLHAPQVSTVQVMVWESLVDLVMQDSTAAEEPVPLWVLKPN